jgi:hypothetical protein
MEKLTEDEPEAQACPYGMSCMHTQLGIPHQHQPQKPTRTEAEQAVLDACAKLDAHWLEACTDLPLDNKLCNLAEAELALRELK